MDSAALIPFPSVQSRTLDPGPTGCSLPRLACVFASEFLLEHPSQHTRTFVSTVLLNPANLTTLITGGLALFCLWALRCGVFSHPLHFDSVRAQQQGGIL